MSAQPGRGCVITGNEPQIGPRPVGPVAKHQPSPEGLGHRFRNIPERQRRGTHQQPRVRLSVRKSGEGLGYRFRNIVLAPEARHSECR